MNEIDMVVGPCFPRSSQRPNEYVGCGWGGKGIKHSTTGARLARHHTFGNNYWRTIATSHPEQPCPPSYSDTAVFFGVLLDVPRPAMSPSYSFNQSSGPPEKTRSGSASCASHFFASFSVSMTKTLLPFLLQRTDGELLAREGRPFQPAAINLIGSSAIWGSLLVCMIIVLFIPAGVQYPKADTYAFLYALRKFLHAVGCTHHPSHTSCHAFFYLFSEPQK
ncbi:hypothetical protein ACLOJK_010454, partial [Asimina triloba]